MRLSRRDLMKFLTAAGVGAAVRPAFAQSTGLDPRRKFLFVYFGGGWDQTLCFDTRDPGLDSMKDQTGIEMGWQHLPAPFVPQQVTPQGSAITFGPAIGNLRNHYDKLCVVRGMSMDTLTHEVGYRYFLTGKPPSGLTPRGSSMGSEIVDQLAAANPGRLGELANFTLDIDSYYTGSRLEAKAFRGSSKNEYAIAASFRRELLNLYGDFAMKRVVGAGGAEDLLAQHRARAFCDPSRVNLNGVMTRLRDTQAQNERMFRSPLLEQFDLSRQSTVAAYVPYFLSAPTGGAGTPGLAAFFARQALVSGLANVVTVTLQDQLDTHTSIHATDHPVRLKRAFDALAVLIDDLANTNDPDGGKFLDHTTIVGFSEFTRTARLNAAGGRDHALTNCCFLLGAGIRGNTVVGASSNDGMQPLPINPMTGAVDPMGTIVKPEHVLATVLETAGYRRDQLLVGGLPCIKRP